MSRRCLTWALKNGGVTGVGQVEVKVAVMYVLQETRAPWSRDWYVRSFLLLTLHLSLGKYLGL